jgi:hypothetical protein
MEIVNWLMAHGLDVVGALVLLCNAIIAIAVLIPGDQPEKFLQGAVDLLSKISRK